MLVEFKTTFKPRDRAPRAFSVDINSKNAKASNYRLQSTVEDAAIPWDSYLRGFHNIHILISTNEDNDSNVSDRLQLFQPVNHHLYSLCCFLAGLTYLKKITVELKEGWNRGSIWVPARTLWPLLKLGNSRLLEFKEMLEGPTNFLHRQAKVETANAVDTLGLAVQAREEKAARMPFVFKKKAMKVAKEMLRSTDYVDHEYDGRLMALLTPREQNPWEKLSATEVQMLGQAVIDRTQEGTYGSVELTLLMLTKNRLRPV